MQTCFDPTTPDSFIPPESPIEEENSNSAPLPLDGKDICTEQAEDGSIVFMSHANASKISKDNEEKPVSITTTAPLFCEFAAFVEHLEAPTGIIQSQTLLRVSSDIFKQNRGMPLPTYNANSLSYYLPNLTELSQEVASTAFIISVQGNQIKVPTKAFYGTYTRYTWNKNRSLRSTVRVYCDRKIISEKINFEQPIAENGLFVFLQRAEVCPNVANIVKEFSQQNFNRKLVFYVNLTDSTEQTNLLTLFFVVDNSCDPFVALFPSDELKKEHTSSIRQQNQTKISATPISDEFNSFMSSDQPMDMYSNSFTNEMNNSYHQDYFDSGSVFDYRQFDSNGQYPNGGGYNQFSEFSPCNMEIFPNANEKTKQNTQKS
mmetsp:Transcript_709/g.978  ORF Transcript_709/g.978 Transcript_709/m.978 type:complete len:374 (+) Transcript_709:68-1189(+)